MATSVDVEYTKSIVEAGGSTKYRLEVICSNPSAGFEEELFLHEVEDTGDLYLHVATIGDYNHYGTTVPALGDKYRKAGMLVDYDSPEELDDAMALISTRLQSVVTDYESGYGSFSGTTTETIESP